MCTLGGCLYLCCCGTALIPLDFEICYIKQTKKDINTNYDCNTYLWVCPVGVRSLLDNLKQTSIRYTTIEIKESSHIGYTGFLFLHSYLGHWLSAEYECGKRNPLYPTRATSFVSIVMYLTCTIFMLWIKF